MPYSWNPTRARGVGVQDMLATTDGLYVGSDTDLIGHTAGNTYHARIAFLPARRRRDSCRSCRPTRCRPTSTGSRPAPSQLQKRAASPAPPPAPPPTSPTGPAGAPPPAPSWSTACSTRLNTDGIDVEDDLQRHHLRHRTAVNTADALVNQTDWHTDVQDAHQPLLLRRPHLLHEVGHERRSTAAPSRSRTASSASSGSRRTTDRASTTQRARRVRRRRQALLRHHHRQPLLGDLEPGRPQPRHRHAAPSSRPPAPAGPRGRSSRYQVDPAALQRAAGRQRVDLLRPAAAAPTTRPASTDPENGPLTYDWDFGDGTAHGTGVDRHAHLRRAGDRAVTLTVTDNKGATNSVTRTASPTSHADTISFVNSRTTTAAATNHTDHGARRHPGRRHPAAVLRRQLHGAGLHRARTAGPQVLSETRLELGRQGLLEDGDAADLGRHVTGHQPGPPTVASRTTVKSDMTLAVLPRHRHAGDRGRQRAPPRTSPAAVHQTPTVNAPDGTGWLVSYWTDKGPTTTGWTRSGEPDPALRGHRDRHRATCRRCSWTATRG